MKLNYKTHCILNAIRTAARTAGGITAAGALILTAGEPITPDPKYYLLQFFILITSAVILFLLAFTHKENARRTKSGVIIRRIKR